MANAERRERILRVRATSEEIERWKAMAQASSMPLSELVRQSIGRARAWSPDRAAIERDRTLQLARIGSNLNQVARWANARKSAADAVRVTAALVAHFSIHLLEVIGGFEVALRNAVSRYVAVYLDQTDPEDREDWTRQHEWLAKSLNDLHRVFAGRVEALDAGDWNSDAEANPSG